MKVDIIPFLLSLTFFYIFLCSTNMKMCSQVICNVAIMFHKASSIMFWVNIPIWKERMLARKGFVCLTTEQFLLLGLPQRDDK